MLFNLTTHTLFPCKDPSQAIRCRNDKGPYFGNVELSAWDEPFNEDNACSSLANGAGYNIPCNTEGINMLTNKNCTRSNTCDFTIS